jgi:hypothetical protein
MWYSRKKRVYYITKEGDEFLSSARKEAEVACKNGFKITEMFAFPP